MPNNELLRQLPKIDELIHNNHLAELSPYTLRIQVIREVVDDLRQNIVSNTIKTCPSTQDIVMMIKKLFHKRLQPNLKRVINGTGVVLHTNLGRAPLAHAALEAIQNTAFDYSNLEFDVASGIRGSRFTHVEDLLTQLTGAEAAMVVNNNAAAIMLALSAHCSGKEVIVSRGELVEIGGSFRVPDVLRQSGCTLVEVGTTNKTHDYDYKNAITENTAAILSVHTSNFTITGFTSKPDMTALSNIAKMHKIPLIEDVGSGCLFDLSAYGIMNQPCITDSIRTGVNLITFSGDKLLGGPQAGILVGEAEIIKKCKKHPLARALRIDKLSLAALEATLRLYMDPNQLMNNLPVLNMICAPYETLHRRAETLKNAINHNDGYVIELIEVNAIAGGGAMPDQNIPSVGVAITHKNFSASKLERSLRLVAVPIIGRIIKDKFILDVRTLHEDTFDYISNQLQNLLTGDTA